VFSSREKPGGTDLTVPKKKKPSKNVHPGIKKRGQFPLWLQAGSTTTSPVTRGPAERNFWGYWAGSHSAPLLYFLGGVKTDAGKVCNLPPRTRNQRKSLHTQKYKKSAGKNWTRITAFKAAVEKNTRAKRVPLEATGVIRT